MGATNTGKKFPTSRVNALQSGAYASDLYSARAYLGKLTAALGQVECSLGLRVAMAVPPAVTDEEAGAETSSGETAPAIPLVALSPTVASGL